VQGEGELAGGSVPDVRLEHSSVDTAAAAIADRAGYFGVFSARRTFSVMSTRGLKNTASCTNEVELLLLGDLAHDALCPLQQALQFLVAALVQVLAELALAAAGRGPFLSVPAAGGRARPRQHRRVLLEAVGRTP